VIHDENWKKTVNSTRVYNLYQKERRIFKCYLRCYGNVNQLDIFLHVLHNWRIRERKENVEILSRSLCAWQASGDWRAALRFSTWRHAAAGSLAQFRRRHVDTPRWRHYVTWLSVQLWRRRRPRSLHLWSAVQRFVVQLFYVTFTVTVISKFNFTSFYWSTSCFNL